MTLYRLALTPGAGYTLLELIVVMTMMSLAFGVASMALGSVLESDETSSWESQLEDARRRAVVAAAPVVVFPDSSHLGEGALFLPDGRAIGLGVDPLTGRVISR